MSVISVNFNVTRTKKVRIELIATGGSDFIMSMANYDEVET